MIVLIGGVIALVWLVTCVIGNWYGEKAVTVKSSDWAKDLLVEALDDKTI